MNKILINNIVKELNKETDRKVLLDRVENLIDLLEYIKNRVSETIGPIPQMKEEFIQVDDTNLNVGDWFQSKFRTENKFFHYVNISEVTPEGYRCSENKIIYPKSDVLYKVERKIIWE